MKFRFYWQRWMVDGYDGVAKASGAQAPDA